MYDFLLAIVFLILWYFTTCPNSNKNENLNFSTKECMIVATLDHQRTVIDCSENLDNAQEKGIGLLVRINGSLVAAYVSKCSNCSHIVME